MVDDHEGAYVPWLLRDDEVLATIEVADSLLERSRGLIGRDHLDGALLLRPALAVHTIGVRFPIDVAYCDRELVVLKAVRMPRNRLSRPVLRARAVIEAPAGAFARWELAEGDELEIRS